MKFSTVRNTTLALMAHYLDQLDVSGDVLEIGGHNLKQCSIQHFPEPRYRYHDLNLVESDIPNTIIADITDCRSEIPDNSFDFIFSSDVFEHIDRPWLAAEEIGRILKPGGITVHHTLWSWRNHPCPIDYWRYSPECLEFLFNGLTVLEKGYDLSQRRYDQPGQWRSGNDSVPVDQFGGWREHWSVYVVARKGSGEFVPRFKDSNHPLAVHLRRDTQGVVTNPKMLGQQAPSMPAETAPAYQVRELEQQIERLTRKIADLEARPVVYPVPPAPPAPVEQPEQRRPGRLGGIRRRLATAWGRADGSRAEGRKAS